MKKRPADTPLAIDAATAKTSKQRTVDALIAGSPSVVLLRDGDLVLYRRTRSLLYLRRFKLAVGTIAEIINYWMNRSIQAKYA